MSMYKKYPAGNIIETQQKQFVSQEQKNNINKIPQLELSNANLDYRVTQIEEIQSGIEQIKIHLVNEEILIVDGKLTLSFTPLSGKLINNTLTIIEKIPSENVYLVHQELIGGRDSNGILGFEVVGNEVILPNGFFNGYFGMVSYIHQE